MRKGATLLETLLVLTVLSVLVYMGSASFVHLGPRYKLHGAAWEVFAHLNQARFRAIQEGRPIRVKFFPDRCDLEAWNEASQEWRLVDRGSPGGVRIQSNNNPVFHPAGTVSNLATILVSNDSGQYRITIAISGRVKIVRM